MRILFVITGLGMGGAEKVVSSLADVLASNGHEICIAFMTGPAVILPTNASIKVVSLRIVSSKDFLNSVFIFRRLIRDFNPDVVHSHMFHANIFARLVRLMIPIRRLISSSHASYEEGKLRMLALRLTNALADISTNVSEEAVAAFENEYAVRPGRMLAVHNGIDVNEFFFNAAARVRIRQELFIRDNCKIILSVGRLHEVKDYPNLFHALAHLPVNGLTYQVCIVGDGPLMGFLQKLAVQLCIADRVRFLGFRHDVADLMSAADVFVLSSAHEGFGLVVAEAMACERVVVATDCGGVKEVIGEAGYLVKPKDPNGLAMALNTALQLSAIESTALGCAARQRVIERYSLGSAVEKWLEIYLGKVGPSK